MLSITNRTYKRLEKLRKELTRCEKAGRKAERLGDFIKLGQIKLAEQEILEQIENLGD